METLLIGGFIVFFIFITWFFFRKTDKEKEFEKYLEKSMEDEFIYDPETGAKLTLEEAESGHFINHDNEFATMPKREIEKLFSEEERDAQHALNYIRREESYLKTTISEELLEILENSRMLSKYDDWSYSFPYSFNEFNTVFLLPAVSLNAKVRGEEHYTESQVLFCKKFDFDLGHFYLREKKTSEKIFDLVRNDDDLLLSGYESFTYRNSSNMIKIIQILKYFEGTKGLEIEFTNYYLLIKNLKLIDLEEVLRIEKIIRSIPS